MNGSQPPLHGLVAFGFGLPMAADSERPHRPALLAGAKSAASENWNDLEKTHVFDLVSFHLVAPGHPVPWLFSLLVCSGSFHLTH